MLLYNMECSLHCGENREHMENGYKKDTNSFVISEQFVLNCLRKNKIYYKLSYLSPILHRCTKSRQGAPKFNNTFIVLESVKY